MDLGLEAWSRESLHVNRVFEQVVRSLGLRRFGATGTDRLLVVRLKPVFEALGIEAVSLSPALGAGTLSPALGTGFCSALLPGLDDVSFALWPPWPR